MKEILVFGWYSHGNIGDELFKDAFKSIFPNYSFTFTDQITITDLNRSSAIFIGGGSFLSFAPSMQDGALEILKTKKIFYIGVGAETDIHSIHKELMKLAKLIAIRTPEFLDKIKSINPNTIAIPDIVYALQPDVINSIKINRSVLIIPNMAVIPKWNDPQWKSVSWNYFKSEFAQFLDLLVESGFNINFLAMCQNNESNDDWSATEIINTMNHRDSNYILTEKVSNIKDITSIISKYETVITQRFHGIVLCEMVCVPYLALHHHDKLKKSDQYSGTFLSYYGLSKNILNDKFNLAINNNYRNELSLNSNIFKDLNNKIINLI